MKKLWTASPPLTVVGLVLLPVLALNLLGMVIDPRTIGGDPAWLKPAKFAASTALYLFSLAFLFLYLGAWPRLRAWAGGVIAASLIVEIVLIDLQAFRGITSHFNTGTAQNAIIFSVMGLSIACLWLASLAVAVALCRQRFDDAALGWALRLGLIITLFGSAIGGLMTTPTAAQAEQLRAGHGLPISGAHTVGAPDGGPGYPLMHWSSEHGDVRVSHFVGLHALQALPLFYLLIRRRSSSAAARTRIVLAAGASYASLVAILLWQALQGEPLFDPGLTSLRMFEAWLLVSAVALAATWGTAGAGNPKFSAVAL